MRKIARGNKFFVIPAILSIALFAFFGNTFFEVSNAKANNLVDSIDVTGSPASATNEGLGLIRVFPSSSIVEFENVSVTGTSAKFTFTVKLKDGIDGSKVTEENTISELGGWDNIFEKAGSNTTFGTDNDTNYLYGHGFYLDVATTKSKIVDLFPVGGSWSDRRNFYTDGTHIESYILSGGLGSLGTTEEATILTDNIKNSEIVDFGKNDNPDINNSEASFPISLTVAQVKPDGFDISNDLDTMSVQEITVSNLYPNTTYYAQVRIEEDISGTDEGDYAQMAISPTIISFKTGDGPTPIGAPVSSAVVADGASAVTDNPDWFLSGFNCGIKIAAWQDDGTSLLDCVPIGLYKFVYVPSAAILYFAGSMLDAFFSWTISSSIYRDSTFVIDGWRIVRDLSNIGFIAALVYAAVSTILQLGNIRRAVVSVIIIGLLINFSLFFSKVVIDVGNTLAKVFYNQITISGVASDSIVVADVEVKSLSQAIVDGMSLQKIISKPTLEAIKNNSYGGTKYSGTSYADEGLVTLMIILGIILNITAAWSFFLISWTFVGRIVGLWIAMIVSPLAFLSRVVPQVGQLGGNFTMSRWFQNLLTLSFLAPIFIFLMYLLILLLDSGFLDSLIKIS